MGDNNKQQEWLGGMVRVILPTTETKTGHPRKMTSSTICYLHNFAIKNKPASAGKIEPKQICLIRWNPVCLAGSRPTTVTP